MKKNLESRIKKAEQKSGAKYQQKTHVNWNFSKKDKEAAKQFKKENPDGLILTVNWVD